MCGCIGVVFAFDGELEIASFFMWTGAIFDFFDGFAARMLKKYSSIGKELDSLADMVTFCFLPSSIFYVLIETSSNNVILPFAAFSMALFGALRLAKFNVDERQTTYFHGLPSPASALVVSAFPFISGSSNGFINDILLSPWALIVIALTLSGLMVSDFKLMSLKFKDFSLKNNISRYILLLTSLILLSWLNFLAIPIIVIFYVILSLTIQIGE